MPLRYVLTFTTLFVTVLATVPNRAKVTNKAVKFGVTFYTSAEMQPILECIEPQLYSDPNDTSTLISTAENCVIDNSASKAVTALSLYSSFNSCTNLDDLIDKLETPFLTIIKQLVNKCLTTLNNCKNTSTLTGTAKQNACINKLYGTGLAIVTKAKVNTYCTKIAAKMNSTEWNCCKTYAPQVVNVALYKCYNVTKS